VTISEDGLVSGVAEGSDVCALGGCALGGGAALSAPAQAVSVAIASASAATRTVCAVDTRET
jgi:hypothetical protein